MMETRRLTLRPWTAAELPTLAAWNADPVIMEHFGGTRTAADIAARFGRMQQWERHLGFTFWAVERRADGRLIGNCGLKPVTVPWPEPTDIEIGWQLARDVWGRGYAREAAEAVLAFGLTMAPRVIAMTARTNRASWGLMRRLGMRHLTALDFHHPDVPRGRYRRQVVFGKRA